jgi:hypothetical protein
MASVLKLVGEGERNEGLKIDRRSLRDEAG